MIVLLKILLQEDWTLWTERDREKDRKGGREREREGERGRAFACRPPPSSPSLSSTDDVETPSSRHFFM